GMARAAELRCHERPKPRVSRNIADSREFLCGPFLQLAACFAEAREHSRGHGARANEAVEVHREHRVAAGRVDCEAVPSGSQRHAPRRVKTSPIRVSKPFTAAELLQTDSADRDTQAR